MPSCCVVNVGHGNSAVLRGDTGVVVVDAGPGARLLDFLRSQQITRVDHLLVSHADADHLRGAMSLLALVRNNEGFELLNIHVNPDSRDTRTWDDFVHDAAALHHDGRTNLSDSIGQGKPERLELGGLQVEVIAPEIGRRLRAVGGVAAVGNGVKRKQTANTLSAVVVARSDSGWAVLLPGDLDEDGLGSIFAQDLNLRCEVVVFPHHGGLSGAGNIADFSDKLLDATQAKHVVFSNGNGRAEFPNAIVIERCLARETSLQVLSIGSSPTLHERLGGSNGTHRNDSGTLKIEWRASCETRKSGRLSRCK